MVEATTMETDTNHQIPSEKEVNKATSYARANGSYQRNLREQELKLHSLPKPPQFKAWGNATHAKVIERCLRKAA